MTRAELSLLVVNFNSWRLCCDALRSFRDHAPRRADGTPMPYEAIVVDNASPIRDPEAEVELRALCEATGGRLVLHDQNGGYSSGMNLAYAQAKGDWIVVSNPDVRYLPDTIDPLLRAMERDPTIGTAAPRGYLDPGREAMLPPNILPTLRDLWHLTRAALWPSAQRSYSRRRTRDAVRVWLAEHDVDLPMLSGCCFLMRRSLIDRIGFFDERFPLYFEDTDLSVRIRRAGKRIVQVHDSRLIHFFDRSGQTANELKMQRYWRSRRLYYRKWYGPIGAMVYDLTRKLLGTAWAKRRFARIPHAQVHDLGEGSQRPTIRIDRARARFLVELCLDPKFFLAGGILAQGDTWTPKDALMDNLGPTTYWFRVVDVDAPGQPEIGIYKYRLLPAAVAAPAHQKQVR
ncbi:MAG: glycosyltransferase family 2 protein [Planctomycetota bacterium]